MQTDECTDRLYRLSHDQVINKNTPVLLSFLHLHVESHNNVIMFSHIKCPINVSKFKPTNEKKTYKNWRINSL